MFEDKNTGLIAAIVFAAVVIGGALIFLGTKLGMSDSDLQVQIAEGINQYVVEQQRAYEEAQAGANVPREVSGDFSDNDAVLGDDDAPVTIVEFSDFQCPFCRSFYLGAYQQIKSEYVETGKVRLIYRDLPLSFHQDALPAALAAECARAQGGDEVYFAMHDKIFEGQNKLNQEQDPSRVLTVEIPDESLNQYATELGLDVSKFQSCVTNEEFKDEIAADQADAQKAGIDGTPGFIINGKVISGAQPFSTFQQVIEAALAESGQ